MSDKGATKYLLDSNVFIEAKNRAYAFDLCPGFWDALISLHAAGRLLSIDRVKMELKEGKDELVDWVTKVAPDSFFKSTDVESVITTYKAVMAWVNDREQFSPGDKAKFSRGADAWLAAFARTNDLTLVTHEQKVSDDATKVKIPNVCERFDIPFVDTFEMLRALNVKFDQWSIA